MPFFEYFIDHILFIWHLVETNYSKKLLFLKDTWRWLIKTDWRVIVTKFFNDKLIFPLFNKKHISFNKIVYYTRLYKYWRKFILSIPSYYYYRSFFKKKFSYKDSLNIILKSIEYKKTLPKNRIQLFYFFLTFFNNTKHLLISILLSLILYFILDNFFYVNLEKQLGIWFIISMLIFWLFSGFNFFIKRYRYAKFTSVILRFWKRTNIYFWISEGFLFTLFIYYYLNSSQEPFYMYDYTSINYNFLPNLFVLYFNNWILIFSIIFFFFWFLNLNAFNFTQNTFYGLIIVLFILYLYYIESYQFYYILTYLFESFWSYNYEENLWTLDFESPKTRVKQQYLFMVLVAKYWHFIFIFLSLLFWSLKSFEDRKTHYTLTGYTLQNIIILFWLNILIITQWFKWVYRRFFDNTYFWFFTDTNNYYLHSLFNEIRGEVRHQKY